MTRTADALVVGGGVIGCAVAWELAKAGMKVALLEKGSVACEASGASAGMLTPQADSEQNDPLFWLSLRSRALFPDCLRELEDRTGIAIEWHQDGLVKIPLRQDEMVRLEEKALWQREAGLKIERLDSESLRRLEPKVSAPVGTAYFFPQEAHLDSLQYTLALAEAARSAGVDVLEGETAAALRLAGDRVIGVSTAHGEWSAGATILCAGAWSATLHPPDSDVPRTEPVRGQMLAVGAKESIAGRLVASEEVYLVPRDGGEILVGATVEWVGFEKLNTVEGIQELLQQALKLLPEIRHATFLRAWAGLRPGTTDSLPVLGPDPAFRGLIHATGHFRKGILLSALTARLVVQTVTDGVTPAVLEPFLPARRASR